MTSLAKKRLRIFAGPNGSGKSTLVKNLPNSKRFNTYKFINADEILEEFETLGCFGICRYLSDFDDLALLKNHLVESDFAINKDKNFDLNLFSFGEGQLAYKGPINSYITADIAAFIRLTLLTLGESFSFESVFSHYSKIEIMTEAKKRGYKVYLYFITTEDPLINVNRVEIRVSEKGHPVPPQKIVDRYYRTMDILYKAIKQSDRCYLFDNSTEEGYKYLAEINSGVNVNLEMVEKIPRWFKKYVLRK